MNARDSINRMIPMARKNNDHKVDHDPRESTIGQLDDVNDEFSSNGDSEQDRQQDVQDSCSSRYRIQLNEIKAVEAFPSGQKSTGSSKTYRQAQEQ